MRCMMFETGSHRSIVGREGGGRGGVVPLTSYKEHRCAAAEELLCHKGVLPKPKESWYAQFVPNSGVTQLSPVKKQ